MDERTDSPDWEILKLLREVRRRVRAGNPQRFLDHLESEPKWVAALPASEAKVARTMLEATRELARRAIDGTQVELEIFVPPPTETPARPEAPVEPSYAVVGSRAEGKNPRVLAVQAAGAEPRRRRRSRAS